jgi:hypothetical protein
MFCSPLCYPLQSADNSDTSLLWSCSTHSRTHYCDSECKYLILDPSHHRQRVCQLTGKTIQNIPSLMPLAVYNRKLRRAEKRKAILTQIKKEKAAAKKQKKQKHSRVTLPSLPLSLHESMTIERQTTESRYAQYQNTHVEMRNILIDLLTWCCSPDIPKEEIIRVTDYELIQVCMRFWDHLDQSEEFQGLCHSNTPLKTYRMLEHVLVILYDMKTEYGLKSSAELGGLLLLPHNEFIGREWPTKNDLIKILQPASVDGVTFKQPPCLFHSEQYKAIKELFHQYTSTHRIL